MLNITDNAEQQKIMPLFRLGFRPFFLSAAIFSVVAVLLWVASYIYPVNFDPVGSTLWWHSHEMIFGFACAVIVGFLLTAVTNWTGQPGISSWPLFFLWSVWLLARLLLAINPESISETAIRIIDMLFLPLAAWFLAKPILAVKQYRNLFFVPVFLLLALCNALMHWPIASVSHGAYAAVMLVTLVMTVMGGRVIPFFTANGTQTAKKDKVMWLEYTSLASVWLLALVFILNLFVNSNWHMTIAALSAVAGVSNLIRFARWRFMATLSIPLLWSLQLAYLFIPVSLILLAAHYAFGVFSLPGVIHGLTVGAMGNMILAMMARVSLGHTGRPLKVKPVISIAFIALIVAAALRLVGVMILGDFYTVVRLIASN